MTADGPGLAAGVVELIQLFDRSDLLELSVERGGRRVLLRKGHGAPAEPPPEHDVAVEPAPGATLKAHMVGVFYWNREKTGKPSIALRQRLEKGQVIGYIEAMDIMNEVETDRSGVVTEIGAAAGQPVEYGQVLVTLQPD